MAAAANLAENSPNRSGCALDQGEGPGPRKVEPRCEGDLVAAGGRTARQPARMRPTSERTGWRWWCREAGGGRGKRGQASGGPGGTADEAAVAGRSEGRNGGPGGSWSGAVAVGKGGFLSVMRPLYPAHNRSADGGDTCATRARISRRVAAHRRAAPGIDAKARRSRRPGRTIGFGAGRAIPPPPHREGPGPAPAGSPLNPGRNDRAAGASRQEGPATGMRVEPSRPGHQSGKHACSRRSPLPTRARGLRRHGLGTYRRRSRTGPSGGGGERPATGFRSDRQAGASERTRCWC